MADSAVGVAGVSEFADEFLGEEPGVDLATAGNACATIADRLPDPKAGSSTIATVLWEVFRSSKAFYGAVDDIVGADAPDGEQFVVRHPLFGGPARHDLLVFNRALRDRDPETAWVPTDRLGWIEEGLQRLAAHDIRQGETNEIAGLLGNSPGEWAGAIREAVASQRFGIVFAAPPETLGLSGQDVVAASAPLMTTRHRDSARQGTAGVVAHRAADESLVLTAALHTLRENPAEPVPDGSGAWLGGAQALVAATHEVTDSALLTPGGLLPTDNWRPLQGALRGVTPRENQRVSFEGVTSGLQHPFVTGWSPDLLSVTPYSQTKLLTTPDTVPGDSGAALVDPDDNLLGFAFDRSEFNARPEFSSWIWADSVVSFHGLHSIALIAG